MVMVLVSAYGTPLRPRHRPDFRQLYHLRQLAVAARVGCGEEAVVLPVV